jgi:GTP-binding protein
VKTCTCCWTPSWRFPARPTTRMRPLQMLVSDLGYSDYLGRLAIGKIFNGTARSRDALVCIGRKTASTIPLKVSKLQVYDGMH